MLKLDPKRLEPEWLTVRAAEGDDPAVRVLMRPIGLKAWRAAQAAVGRGIVGAGGVLTDELTEDLGDEMSMALIKAGLIEWEGIGDLDGTPITPTADRLVRDEAGAVIETIPGTVSMFLADPRDFDAIDAQYVIPFMNREREKNGSSLSSDGISTRAMPVPDTASLAASLTASAAAPAAPMSSTNRKPTKRPSRRKS